MSNLEKMKRGDKEIDEIKAEIEFSLEQEIEITVDAIANISLCIS